MIWVRRLVRARVQAANSKRGMPTAVQCTMGLCLSGLLHLIYLSSKSKILAPFPAVGVTSPYLLFAPLFFYLLHGHLFCRQAGCYILPMWSDYSSCLNVLSLSLLHTYDPLGHFPIRVSNIIYNVVVHTNTTLIDCSSVTALGS
jgi:hypothetical protein